MLKIARQELLYTINYKLNEEEKSTLLQILLDPERRSFYKFTSTTILLLKEFDFDIRRLLRLALADKKAEHQLFHSSFAKTFTLLIKEAIILVAIQNNKNSEEPLTIKNLVNQPKYKRIGITRNTLYRAVKKYNVDLRGKEAA